MYSSNKINYAPYKINYNLFENFNSSNINFAIVTMTRKPKNINTWIKYHLKLGCKKIFLRIEETPGLKKYLKKKYKNKIIVIYDFDNVDKKNNYQGIIERQEKLVNKSLEECKKYNIKWLFHIDDDELIYSFLKIENILKKIPENVTSLKFQNWEAVPEIINSKNFFKTSNKFINCIEEICLSYANGKAAGRVKESKFWGPHNFTGKSKDIKEIIILHYDSNTINNWLKKFKGLKNTDINSEKFKEIPFDFYKNSIKLLKKNPDNKSLVKFYKENKINNYKNKNKKKINVFDNKKLNVNDFFNNNHKKLSTGEIIGIISGIIGSIILLIIIYIYFLKYY